MDDRSDATIRAVDISCEIVGMIERLGYAGVSEIAAEVDHSKSTVHNHLTTLRNNDIVAKDENGYRLSLRFVEYSQHVKNQRFDYSLVREVVDDLATETDERAQFGSADYGRLVYLYRARGDSDINRRAHSGIQEPLHCTALGKSLLAFMPQDRIDEIIDRHGLEKRTPNTITDYETLMTELDRVRERKFAVDNEELTRGMRCVAAPVMGDDTAIGAIGVSGPVSRLEDERLTDDLATEVRRVANVIEINSIFSE